MFFHNVIFNWSLSASQQIESESIPYCVSFDMNILRRWDLVSLVSLGHHYLHHNTNSPRVFCHQTASGHHSPFPMGHMLTLVFCDIGNL